METYAYQYNTGYHQSLKASPFEVFYGRKPNSDIDGFDLLPSACEVDTVSFRNWKSSVDNIREKAKETQIKSQDQMVKRHKNKHLPSVSKVGETVIFKVQIRKY